VSAPKPHRRAFLSRLALLGAGAAAFLAVRHQLAWPTPKIVFRQGASSGWLPLAGEGRLIELPARVRGVAVQAIIDSGAQYSAIDAGLAEQLGLSAAIPIPLVAFGVSGPPSVTRAVRLDADLGAFRIEGLRAAALDLRPLSELTRQPFSLLLGRDFLRAVVLEADLPARRIALLAVGSWVQPPSAQPVAGRLQSGGLMVKIRIEGGPPVKVMLDTGATGGLALAEDTARAAGLFDGRPMRTSPSVTLGGVMNDGIVRARSVEFAGQSFLDVDVQIYRPARGSPAPMGLLGLGVLERFRIALDLSSARLVLLGPVQPPRRRGGAPPARFGGFADLEPPH